MNWKKKRTNWYFVDKDGNFLIIIRINNYGYEVKFPIGKLETYHENMTIDDVKKLSVIELKKRISRLNYELISE